MNSTHLYPSILILAVHIQPDPYIVRHLRRLFPSEGLLDDAVAELHEVLDLVI